MTDLFGSFKKKMLFESKDLIRRDLSESKGFAMALCIYLVTFKSNENSFLENKEAIIKASENMAYAEFLKPIRDLAKNWDINIATALEDYLDELTDLSITLDGGASKLNFAEAALLIQGTSVVYAKKVEYLYTLVYKTLEALTNKKKKEEEGKEGKEGAPQEDELVFDVELNFLLLDDMISEGKNITLMDEDVDAIDNWEHEDVEFGRGRSARRTSGMSNRRLSNASAISKGSAALNASLVADIGSSGLRLMTSDVDGQGAILLPGSNAFKTDDDEDYNDEDGFNDVGDDDDLEGFDIGDDFQGNDFHDDNNNNNNRSLINASTISAVSDTLGNIETLDNNTSTVSSKSNAKSHNDPWTFANPNSAGTAKPKPLVAGKTYTLPPGLVNDALVQDTSALNESTESGNTSINKSSFVVEEEDLTLKGLAYGKEFTYVAESIKKVAAKRKKSRNAGGRGFAYPKRAARIVEEDDNDDDGFDNNNDYDDDNGGDFQGNDERDSHRMERKVPLQNKNIDGDQFEEMFGGRGNNQEEKRYGSNPMDETMYEERFEALCKAHLRAFAAGAERYAAESQLSKRVTDWSGKLKPVLDSEEEREAFDIHKTGQVVLDVVDQEMDKRKGMGKNFSGDLNVVDFQTICDGKEQYDVCRLFLASLMLANAGNVSLGGMGKVEGKIANELTVEFHGNSVISLPMNEYQAPSVAEQRAVGAENMVA
jgi:condensin-2 complex subunit H2